MKIRLVSIPVQNQDKALDFYTNILGFEKKHDVPLGSDDRWLTVVSNEDREGPELLLEPAPNNFEAAKNYQNSLFESGIPYTQFDVEDVQKEYDRLKGLGVAFSMEPTNIGTAKLAIFDDTCGNLIQLVEVLS